MPIMQAIRRQVRRRLYDSDTRVRRGRTARMHDMLRLLQLPSKPRILDIGGTPYVWNLLEHDCRVTLLNRPTVVEQMCVDRERFEVACGDATNLKKLFADHSFDVVFSNSVIEHVGDESKQKMFAEEARRIGRAYWIQTPSDQCILEPHSFYPLQWQIRRMLGMELVRRGVRVLSKEWMQQLFPDGQLYVERVYGMEKSYSMYRPYPTAGRK